MALSLEDDVKPLWRHRDYMLLWSGQLVSVLGSGVSGLAYPLLVLAMTGSPGKAGIMGALATIPYLIFSLPAGALVDRWNRKRVMIVCDTGRALALGSIPLAALTGHLTLAQVYTAATVEGSLFVFFNIAEVAALPRVVPKEQLPTASAQNEAATAAAFLVAPPLGGFLYQALGRTVPFLVDAVSYAASVLTLSLIRTEFQEEREPAERHLLREIREGLSWLWHNPLIRYMAFLTGGLNFGGGLGLVLIVLARSQGASPGLIGVMFAIGAGGGLVGALLAPRIQKRFGFGQVITTTVAIQACLTFLFAIAPNPIVLGIILASLYIPSPIYNAVQFGYRLQIIPDQLQGRVNSAFRLVAFGFQPAGMAMAGFLLQSIGPVSTVLVFASVTSVLALITVLNGHVRHARPVAAAA